MNSVPVANRDRYYTAVDVPLVSSASLQPSVLDNDEVVGASLIGARLSSPPANGTLVEFNADGTFTYQPNSGFVGLDRFSYVAVSDNFELTVQQVSVAVGTRLQSRSNLDSNIFNAWTVDPWLQTSLLDPTSPSAGLGSGLSNVPEGCCSNTEGGLATTGGLQLVEDVAQDSALVYRSDSLTNPIVVVETALAPGLAVPTTITAQLTFNGVPGPQYAYATAGLVPEQDLRFAIQTDASSLATGMYDYTLAVTTIVGGLATTQNFSGKQAIVNRDDNEFGIGWSLDGQDRLYAQTDGALIVRGNGDSLWFPLEDGVYGYAAGDTSRSRLVKHSYGTFTLTSKMGIVSAFSTLGLLSTRQDTNGNTISYAYSDMDGDSVQDELVSVTDAFGRSIDFSYSGGRVSSITHFSGKVTNLAHDAGKLTGYTLPDPDGAGGPASSPSISFSGYSTSLLTRTDATGDATEYNFSADGCGRSIFQMVECGS